MKLILKDVKANTKYTLKFKLVAFRRFRYIYLKYFFSFIKKNYFIIFFISI